MEAPVTWDCPHRCPRPSFGPRRVTGSRAKTTHKTKQNNNNNKPHGCLVKGTHRPPAPGTAHVSTPAGRDGAYAHRARGRDRPAGAKAALSGVLPGSAVCSRAAQGGPFRGWRVEKASSGQTPREKDAQASPSAGGVRQSHGGVARLVRIWTWQLVAVRRYATGRRHNRFPGCPGGGACGTPRTKGDAFRWARVRVLSSGVGGEAHQSRGRWGPERCRRSWAVRLFWLRLLFCFVLLGVI